MVVNADDFGFTRDVNEGIVHAHRHGILTATTLMATGDAFDHAAAAARQTPTLDVGCHLVLIGGTSLRSAYRFPDTIPDLMQALARGDIRPYEEFKAQIDRIRHANITPIHLDTHKHAHLLPPVLDAVARLSQECQIPWVRRPFDLPGGQQTSRVRRLVAQAIRFLRYQHFTSVLNRHQCRTTDHFSGFSLTGYLNTQSLCDLISRLPAGSTELMVHPGFLGPDLAAARTRLKRSRLIELDALTDPLVRQALPTHSVTLAGFRHL